MDRSNTTERLASLEQRLGDHEARCEERLCEIKATVRSTLQAIDGLKSRAWGVVAALLAWALAQLWSDNAHHFERLDRRQSAVIRAVATDADALGSKERDVVRPGLSASGGS